MKKHKLNITRPEFLSKFMASVGMSEESLSKLIPSATFLLYASYCAIMDSDLKSSDVLHANYDGESVALRFKDKATVKKIYAKSDGAEFTIANNTYGINIKPEGSHLFVTVDFLSHTPSFYETLLADAEDNEI